MVQDNGRLSGGGFGAAMALLAYGANSGLQYLAPKVGGNVGRPRKSAQGRRQSPSKYMPHQGAQERARRVRQMARTETRGLLRDWWQAAAA